MSGPPDPVPDPEHEIRIGLVLYGGVSLAIYMYGVCYELYRMVRASRGAEENPWTGVLQDAKVTATVDIVSGASAGGLNGILLGKALAAGGNMSAVRSLWVDDANLDDILQEPGVKEPASLLQSATFERLIKGGLETMDRQGDGESLVSAFDLFISVTRLRPWVRDFETSLGTKIQTSDYRKSFNLKYRRQGYNPVAPDLGYDRNDFSEDENQNLIEIARGTSAFPAAFEPEKVAIEDRNRKLFQADEPNPSYFSDGGILHNKPFTETISTILTRAAALPVRRWLISVEPDPETAIPSHPDEEAPEVAAVVSKALFGIPRYQSIAADLERLQQHRGAVQSARQILRGVDSRAAEHLEASGTASDDLSDLRAQQVTATDYDAQRGQRFAAECADRVSASWRLRDREALSASVREICLELYTETADFAFDRRRLRYLLELLRLLAESPGFPDEAKPDIQSIQLGLWAEADRLDYLLWSLFDDEPGPWEEPTGFRQRAAPATVRALLERLSEGLEPIRGRTRVLCADADGLVPPRQLPRPLLAAVFDQFELWDTVLLPLEQVSSVDARNLIRLARISPEDAGYIRKSADRKIAGDVLGHFGGFLRREWRKNDILWGRLDAAEMITRILVKDRDLDQAKLESQIRTVQTEIAKNELPDLQGDYRSYLEDQYRVGEESLAAIPMEKRADLVLRAAGVVRNMFRRASTHPEDPSRGERVLQSMLARVGRVLGFALAIVRWPVLAIWGGDKGLKRLASLVVLFIAAWVIVTLVLICLDVIEATDQLWLFIGAAILIFATWTFLLWLAHRDRKAQKEPSA